MFENTILLIMFNHSSNVNNKQFLKELYKPFFKTVIFYSDIQATDSQPEDNEINYLNTHHGHFGHRIFKHFYLKYKSLIDDSDGLFYTMDDNIINLNILNLFTKNKIIYYNPCNHKYVSQPTSEWFDCVLQPLEKCGSSHPSWWPRPVGKPALSCLLKDPEFLKYGINKFTAKFSDFFFLPKKYLTDKLFNLFELFYKHKVFLEISIPSVIHNTESDLNCYSIFNNDINWNRARDRSCPKFNNYNNIYRSINHQFNLFLHPIKFNLQRNSTTYLNRIFNKKKCIIITTINPPTETILKHIQSKDYDVIIVGDNKTPDIYYNLECIYLDMKTQHSLFPDLHQILPQNHYGRKNIGYLFAIKRNYEIIYETDDDNIPLSNFDNILTNDIKAQTIKEKETPWLNIFNFFKDNNNNVWPRGYPISLIGNSSSFEFENKEIKPSIICGMVKNDPDVDALFRLTQPQEYKWKTDKNIFISNENICVFNTQNTFWINKNLFISMLIPSSVSFRYCDILRGIICNIILNRTNNHLLYTTPNVIQKRNEHDLVEDLKSELSMYKHNENILNIINKGVNNTDSVKDMLSKIYNNLYTNKIIKKSDIDTLNIWLKYF